MKPSARHAYLGLLATLYAVLWLALAIRPLNRSDWLLENALVLLFGTVLVVTRRWFVFSRVSYTLIFLFLCRSEEHTSELQSLMRLSIADFCLKKQTTQLTK